MKATGVVSLGADVAGRIAEASFGDAMHRERVRYLYEDFRSALVAYIRDEGHAEDVVREAIEEADRRFAEGAAMRHIAGWLPATARFP